MLPRKLEFDWRVEISDAAKARIRKDIQDILDRYQGLVLEPRLVVVTRPGIDPNDRTLLADIRARPDERIGTATISENGIGRLCFRPAG